MYLRPEVCSPGARGKLLWARGRSSTDSRPRCWFCFFCFFRLFWQTDLASLINKVLPLNSLLLISFVFLDLFLDLFSVYRLWVSVWYTSCNFYERRDFKRDIHCLQCYYEFMTIIHFLLDFNNSWNVLFFEAVPWLLAHHKAIKAGPFIFIWCCCLVFVYILQLVGICFVFVFRVSLDLWSGKQAWCRILG